MKLGDAVETVAKPIAKALNLPCLDQQGNLRPESGCGRRKERWNNVNLGEAIWDFLWTDQSKDKKE